MSGLYHPDFLLRTESARRLYHEYAGESRSSTITVTSR